MTFALRIVTLSTSAAVALTTSAATSTTIKQELQRQPRKNFNANHTRTSTPTIQELQRQSRKNFSANHTRTSTPTTQELQRQPHKNFHPNLTRTSAPLHSNFNSSATEPSSNLSLTLAVCNPHSPYICLRDLQWQEHMRERPSESIIAPNF